MQRLTIAEIYHPRVEHIAARAIHIERVICYIAILIDYSAFASAGMSMMVGIVGSITQAGNGQRAVHSLFSLSLIPKRSVSLQTMTESSNVL